MSTTPTPAETFQESTEEKKAKIFEYVEGDRLHQVEFLLSPHAQMAAARAEIHEAPPKDICKELQNTSGAIKKKHTESLILGLPIDYRMVSGMYGTTFMISIKTWYDNKQLASHDYQVEDVRVEERFHENGNKKSSQSFKGFPREQDEGPPYHDTYIGLEQLPHGHHQTWDEHENLITDSLYKEGKELYSKEYTPSEPSTPEQK